MKRIFLECAICDVMQIQGADAHHLHHVLRAKVGEKILVADGAGSSAEAEITGFLGESVKLRLVRLLEDAPKALADIELFQCLPKGDRMDFIVQKATELGVTRILPLFSQNVVVRLDKEKARARHERWQKIAAAAAKQCGARKIPEVLPLAPFLEAIKKQQEIKQVLRLFFYEGEQKRDLHRVFADAKARRIFMLVGPEGGFSKEEAGQAAVHGFTSVTLGQRILRVDTAAIVALSLVQYEKGDLGVAKSSIDDLGLQGQSV